MLADDWGKSSYCHDHGGGDCLEARWQKSSYSTNPSGCVEARAASGVVQVRDSKQHGQGPVLEFAPADWMAFLATLAQHRAG